MSRRQRAAVSYSPPPSAQKLSNKQSANDLRVYNLKPKLSSSSKSIKLPFAAAPPLLLFDQQAITETEIEHQVTGQFTPQLFNNQHSFGAPLP